MPASLTITQVSLAAPTVVGENCTVSCREELAAIVVFGSKLVVALKGAPLGRVSALIVSGDAPVFCTWKLSVALCPTCTLPKVSDAGERARLDGVVGVGVGVDVSAGGGADGPGEAEERGVTELDALDDELVPIELAAATVNV